ncbi:hypothetical protein PVAP13_5KG676607 [Panicum virgatum]|uniref:Uncharacterized protein n=1 Tax=Panicum virgatum TaxID=38727 RepID=A0A8T0SZC2_PANVG|nr:hypothetical protein PVAP13_5KG676607 [Panicum virgatum]
MRAAGRSDPKDELLSCKRSRERRCLCHREHPDPATTTTHGSGNPLPSARPRQPAASASARPLPRPPSRQSPPALRGRHRRARRSQPGRPCLTPPIQQRASRPGRARASGERSATAPPISDLGPPRLGNMRSTGLLLSHGTAGLPCLPGFPAPPSRRPQRSSAGAAPAALQRLASELPRPGVACSAGPNRGRAPALRPSGSAACRDRRTLPSSRREPSLLPLKA